MKSAIDQIAITRQKNRYYMRYSKIVSAFDNRAGFAVN